MKRKNLFFALVLAGAMSVAASASCIGNCGDDTANGDVTAPPIGSGVYSFVSTSGGVTGGGNYPVAAAAPNSTATDGSTLSSSSFTANSGDQLNFDFNFITSDGSHNFPDFAWAVLEDTSGDVLETLFSAQTTPTPGNTVPDTNLPANTATLSPLTSGSNAGSGSSGGPVWAELGGSSGTCYTNTQSNGCGLTGWINSLYTISAADVTAGGGVVGTSPGTFELVFGVSNANDTAFDTGLAVAGETIAGQGIGDGTAPEPSTWVMLGGALILFGFFGRRRLVRE